MTFRRGATLPVAVTLGHADTCDLGPTAGNGFYTRWPDDLALLVDLGVTDLRLTFDWARFQPKPGEFAGAWVERYEHVLGAARAIGLSVWASLYDAGVPKWLVNEGGLDHRDTVTAWWPRWVERVADRFGGLVDGWIPFAEIPGNLPDQPWIDTWQILGGGRPPVVLSVAAPDDLGIAQRHLGRFDHLGISLDALVAADVEVTDAVLDEESARWRQALEEAAEITPRASLMVSRFTPNHDDPDADGLLVERAIATFDDAIRSGIDVVACLIEPAIAGPDSARALLDSGRRTRPAADVFLSPGGVSRSA